MGVSYNAYLVAGEKIALIDTVEESFGSRLEANISEAIGERKIDYLVVNHMEPDHSSSIAALRRIYPDIEIELRFDDRLVDLALDGTDGLFPALVAREV